MEDQRKLFTCKECQKRFMCFSTNRVIAGLDQADIMPEEVKYFMQRPACADLVLFGELTNEAKIV
jgi:hypothetical protein